MKLWRKVIPCVGHHGHGGAERFEPAAPHRAGKRNLDYAVQSAVSTHTANAVYFEKAMHDGAGEQLSAAAKRSLARYYVSSLADPNIILTAADDVVYNATSIDPALYLPLETQGKAVRHNGYW